MPCTHPLHGSRLPSGVVSVKFRNPRLPSASVPCGQCLFCRRQKALEYAVLITHELDAHEQSSFVTLTYSDFEESGPEGITKRRFDGAGLAPEHISEFFKRFRERIAPLRIRHFSVGEYGELNHRPHYHSIIFGWYPTGWDIIPLRRSLVTSELITQAWGHGEVSIGHVTPESAAYVAGYSLKKITGKHQEEHYYNPETGEYRKPEFVRLSKHLGEGFLKRLSDGEFVDGVGFNDRVVSVPRIYKKRMRLKDETRYERIKKLIEERPRDYTDLHRLSKIDESGQTVQDVVDKARLKNRKRELDK